MQWETFFFTTMWTPVSKLHTFIFSVLDKIVFAASRVHTIPTSCTWGPGFHNSLPVSTSQRRDRSSITTPFQGYTYVTVAQSYKAYTKHSRWAKGTLCSTEVWGMCNKPCVLNGWTCNVTELQCERIGKKEIKLHQVYTDVRFRPSNWGQLFARMRF